VSMTSCFSCLLKVTLSPVDAAEQKDKGKMNKAARQIPKKDNKSTSNVKPIISTQKSKKTSIKKKGN